MEKSRDLRKYATKPEEKIWYEILRKKMTGYRFLRQKPISSFIVDFYCSKLLLAIEIDGDTHYEQKAIVYDRKRTEILNKFGIKVIRYTNFEVMDNIEGIEFNLRREIEKREGELGIENPPVPPLQGGNDFPSVSSFQGEEDF